MGNTQSFQIPRTGLSVAVQQWFSEYLARDHPELLRDGPVCPFVRPALNAGDLKVIAYPWSTGDGVGTLVKTVQLAAEEFRRASWAGKNESLRSLVIVVDGMAESEYGLIDLAHEETKTELVRQGLMLGQFHPHCDAPSARNPELAVNRSPYPMFAIRNMAFHDILFLHSSPVWMAEYVKRFGDRYGPEKNPDPVLRELFENASADES